VLGDSVETKREAREASIINATMNIYNYLTTMESESPDLHKLLLSSGQEKSETKFSFSLFMKV
jgi:hypothetical protein